MKKPLVYLLFVAQASMAQHAYDTLPNLPEHYLKRMAIFKQQPIITGKVMMVGNSITEGGDWKKLLNDSSCINRGISGDVTFGVLNRLEDIIQRKPSRLFLLIGINDLSRNTPNEVIIKNIFNIVSRIREGSPQTAIFVQSILPLNEGFKNFPEQFKNKKQHVAAINGQLAKDAEKLKFTFINLHSKFVDKNGNLETKFATDGLHLSASGYQHWAVILKNYIKK